MKIHVTTTQFVDINIKYWHQKKIKLLKDHRETIHFRRYRYIKIVHQLRYVHQLECVDKVFQKLSLRMYPARMCRLRNAIVKFENFPREVILGGDYPVIFHFLNVLTPSFFHSSALIQICWNCSMLASEHAPMYALWYRWGEAWTYHKQIR